MARACELGVAMQLTNIARDVGEDARMGRLYLPRTWLREEGLDPDAWLAKPSFGPEIARVVSRLLSAADALYRRAEEGVWFLPRGCRPDAGIIDEATTAAGTSRPVVTPPTGVVASPAAAAAITPRTWQGGGAGDGGGAAATPPCA